MEKKKKIIIVLAILIILICFLLYFFVFQQEDDTDKFIGKWEIKQAMGGIPYNATAYFTFYENGSLEQSIIYDDGWENITWKEFWIKNDKLYIPGEGGSSSPPLPIDYNFSNDESQLTLKVMGYLYAELTKV